MKNLLAADFYRIFKDKMFKVILIVCGIIAIIMPAIYIGVDLVVYYSYENVDEAMHMFCAVDIFSIMFGITGVVTIVVPIFTSILLFKDYGSGIVRNKILAGYKRNTIYLANFVENLIIQEIVTVSVALIGFFLSWIFLPFNCDASLTTGEAISKLFFILLVNICIISFLSALTTFFVTGLRNLPLALIVPYVLLSLATVVLTLNTIAYFIVPTSGEANHILLKILECINFYGGRDMLFNPLMGETAASIFAIDARMNGEVYETAVDLIHILSYTLVPIAFGAILTNFGMMAFNKKDLK